MGDFVFYDKLKKICKSKETTVTAVLKSIGIDKSNGTHWKNGSFPSGDVLIKLSKHLDVSVDYLLDINNNPNSHKEKSTNTVNGNYNAIDNSSVTIGVPTLDEHQKLLLELYNKLSPIEQVELISKLNKDKAED